MKHARPLSPADRDRALARLRTMTIATTLAGVAAVGGFGTIAAASYRGATTTDPVTAAVTISDQATAAAATATTTPTDPSSATSAATTAPNVTPAPTVTPTSGSAHASTGGS